jgi:hypothetical protein
MRAKAISRKTKQQTQSLRLEIRESVRRCSAADKEENRALVPAGFARRIAS